MPVSWQRSLLVIIVSASLAALVAASIYTGRDVPVTLAGLLGTVLGVAIGADAFEVVRREEGKRKGGGDGDSHG